MTRYFFDLCDGAGGVRDDVGTELADDRAAVDYGNKVAQELVRSNEERSRHWCIAVRDETRSLLFTLPFVAVEETINRRFPETRALVERYYDRIRALAEAKHAAVQTMRQSRALVARSHGRPYLATENGYVIGLTSL